jgi:hypothetical protein
MSSPRDENACCQVKSAMATIVRRSELWQEVTWTDMDQKWERAQQKVDVNAPNRG